MAEHIRKMAYHLHADAIQQLEIALLGSSAAEVMDISASMPKQATVTSAQPCPPKTKISNIPVPPSKHK